MAILPLKPGVINKGSATSLTINGPVVGNPMHKWLNGFAAGEVTFGDGSVDYVLPQWFGATGVGTVDQTTAIQVAVASFYWTHFPPGFYHLTNEITSTVQKKITGVRFETFINQGTLTKSVFSFGSDSADINNVVVKDVYLGSQATSSGTACLKLKRVHRSNIDVICQGGYTHIHTEGCILNEIRYLTGQNLGTPTEGWPAGWTWPSTTYGVYAIPHAASSIMTQANTYVNPIIEGVLTGFYQDYGGFTIIGGTIEACSVWGMDLNNIDVRSTIVNTSFEQNGPASPWHSDIRVNNLRYDVTLNLIGVNTKTTITGGGEGKIIHIGGHLYTSDIGTSGYVHGVGAYHPNIVDTNKRFIGNDRVLNIITPGLAHGMTDLATTETSGRLSEANPSVGGMYVRGFGTGGGIPLFLEGASSEASPTVTMIRATGGKKSGTSWGALANTEIVFEVYNFGTMLLRLLGSGALSLRLAGIPIYANNAAAIAGGLASGDVYRTGADPDTICIVH